MKNPVTTRQCAKRVYSGARYDMGGHPCGTPASIQHEGKWYCKRHYPPNAEARNNAQLDKWEAEWKAQQIARQREREIVEARDAVIEAAKVWAFEGPSVGEVLFNAVKRLRELEATDAQ